MSAKPGTVLKENIWTNNPVFIQMLGICSTLAVTNNFKNTLIMTIGVCFVTAFSNFTVSLIKSLMPNKVRMIVQTLIIAFYVIIVDLVLKAYWAEMSTNLGPYVGLIITNCIVMGRCEAYGNTNPPGPAFLDGLFNALGYSFILLIIATIRELLGMGTVLGYPMPYFSGPHWDKWLIMVAPPGAFFMLGIITWIFRSIEIRREKVNK